MEEALVAFCFDGGLPWHFRAADELELRGGFGTFFVDSTALMGYLREWRSLEQRGHQIGALPLGDLTGTDGVLTRAEPALYERETELLLEAFDAAGLPSPLFSQLRPANCIVFDREEEEFWNALSAAPPAKWVTVQTLIGVGR